MSKVKASLVVMSHLSDAQEEMNNAGNRTANHHINFAKYLIFHLGNDLNVEIDGNVWYEKFCNSKTNLAE